MDLVLGIGALVLGVAIVVLREILSEETQKFQLSLMKRAAIGKCLLLLAAPCCSPLPAALACSVCYGEPDSPMTRGLTWAIIALGGIVGGGADRRRVGFSCM